jgi:hypothetical protein
MGQDHNTIQKDTEVLLQSRIEVVFQVNTEKTKYIVTSCQHNAGQSHNLLTENRSFENLAMIKYLGEKKQTKVAFTKKLKVYEILGMIVTIQVSTFCLQVSSLNTSEIKTYTLFCMDVIVSLLH